MADGSKWIAGLTPEMPASLAAIKVLTPRLKLLDHYLPLVLEEPDRDLEAVHQLRVSTRRSGAGLRLFRDVLPKTWRQETKETLRNLRQAAGAARDWDVFQLRVQSSPGLQEQPAARQVLLAYVLGQRAAAQTSLNEQGLTHQLRVADVLQSMPDEEELNLGGSTLSEIAQLELVEFLNNFSASLNTNPSKAEELHQLRIQGKRLRYALEVFAGCYDPVFKTEFYPLVEEVQDILGAIQDGHTGMDRLSTLQQLMAERDAELAKLVQPGLSTLRKEFQGEITTQKKQFRSWCKRWQKWDHQEDWSAWLHSLGLQTPGPDVTRAGGGNGSESLPPDEESGSSPEEAPSGETTPPLPRPVGKSSRSRSRGKTSGKAGSKSGRGG